MQRLILALFILATTESGFDGCPSRTCLASERPQEAFLCEELRGKSFSGHDWQKETQEAEEDSSIVEEASLLELRKFSNCHKTQNSHDVVLSGMSETKFGSESDLQDLQKALDGGLAVQESAQKRTQQKSEASWQARRQEGRAVSTSISIDRNSYGDGFSRQSSLDPIDTSYENDESLRSEGRHEPARRASTTNPTASSSSEGGNDRIGRDPLDTSQSLGQNGGGAPGRSTFPIRCTDPEGEEQCTTKGAFTQPYQQIRQGKGEDREGSKEDQRGRSRLGTVCKDDHEQDSGTWHPVSTMQGRAHEHIQHENCRDDGHQGGGHQSFADFVEHQAGGVGGICGGTRHSSIHGRNAEGARECWKGDQYLRYRRGGADRGIHGRGGDGIAGGWRFEETCPGEQAFFPRSAISIESSESAFEKQAESSQMNQTGSGFDVEVDESKGCQVEALVNNLFQITHAIQTFTCMWKKQIGCSGDAKPFDHVDTNCLKRKGMHCGICHVHFSSKVEVLVWHEDLDESSSFVVQESIVHKRLRNLWHLYGQIGSWSTFKHCSNKWSSQSHADNHVDENTTTSGGTSRHHVPDAVDVSEVEQTSFEFLRLALASSAGSRQKHVQTWLLAEGRFHLCISPRKIAVSVNMQTPKLKQLCRQVWNDLLVGEYFEMQIVSKGNAASSIEHLHVLVVQRQNMALQSAILFAEALPPLQKHRAVLYENRCTALDILVTAQIHRPCSRQDVTCSIRGTIGPQAIMCNDYERCEFEDASFLEGWFRVIQEEEVEDVTDTLSEASTATGHDETDSDDDSVFMSIAPVMSFQIDQQQPYPWLNDHAEIDADEDDTGDEHEVIIPDWSLQQIAMRNEARAQAVAPWRQGRRLITFGLGLGDLGRRDTTVDPQDPDDLKERVRILWNDQLAFGPISIYSVTPQPRLDDSASLVVLVVVHYENMEDATQKAVLVIEDSGEGNQHRTRPYASYLGTPASARTVALHLGLHQCAPIGLRTCEVRVGSQELAQRAPRQIHDGSLCEVRINPYPSNAWDMRNLVANSEDFLLAARAQYEQSPDDERVILCIHGISPRNVPLGSRELYSTYRQVGQLSWIMDVQSLWHFHEYEMPRVTFVRTGSGIRIGDAELPVFHFIVSYARGHAGMPVLVYQRIQGPTAVHIEAWAVMLHPSEEEANVFNQIWRHPFWFHDLAVTRLRRFGEPIDDNHVPWQPGDTLDLLLDVPTDADVLLVMLDTQMQYQEEPMYEHVHLLQTKVNIRMPQDAFTEVWKDLVSHTSCEVQEQCDIGMKPEDDLNLRKFHVSKNETDRQRQVEVQAHETNQDFQQQQQVREIREIVVDLLQPEWEGLNVDFAILHGLHPTALHAIHATATATTEGTRFHIFTDGSAGKTSAAWAFVVLHEIPTEKGPVFCRVGYAGGFVHREDGEVPTSADAEAQALISMGDFLLSRPWRPGMEVHCHFDCVGVGFGAFGDANIPWQRTDKNTKAYEARIVMSLVQRKFDTCKGLHVHAHEGNPFNELADGIANHIRRGHSVPTQAIDRTQRLLRHPLREWAWMEVSPTAELPDLEGVANDPEHWTSKAWIDPTLQHIFSHDEQQQCSKTVDVKVVTVNVGTCEYNLGDSECITSVKVKELAKQLHIMIACLQETRARHLCTATEGPYVRIISPSQRGIGGMETWIHQELIQQHFGISFEAMQDATTWFHDERILAIHLTIGPIDVNLVNIYAPQRGRPDHEVTAWWKHLKTVLEARPNSNQIWLMGDCNARLGSVCSEVVGDNDPDFEDLAGSLLHELCLQFRLVVPSTKQDFHQGQSWTFQAPRGGCHRLDFHSIDSQCTDAIVSTQVMKEFETLGGVHDHLPLKLHLQLTMTNSKQPQARRTTLYDRQLARNVKHEGRHYLAGMPAIPWQVHANEHWSHIRQTLQDEAVQRFPKPKRQRRQIYFSESAWSLVCRRKEVKALHRHQQKARQIAQLRACFAAWKGDPVDEHEYSLHCLRMQEAVLYEQQQKLDSSFRAHKKKDWQQWAQTVLEQQIDSLKHDNGAKLFRILQPKRAIARQQGKHRRPAPGLKDGRGQWCIGKTNIAYAWQQQFGRIENAEQVDQKHFSNEQDATQARFAGVKLSQIPTILDLEWAFRCMNSKKATGVDGIGPELWQGNVVDATVRFFPLFLKTALRQQWVPEHSGGWMIPLFKGRGDPMSMSTHRGIMLEPAVARGFSRAWRSTIAQGVADTAQPNQYGGRRGLSCSALHLQLRLAQQTSMGRKQSQGLVFVDFKSAFYSVAKDLLVHHKRSTDEFQQLCQTMNIPESAKQAFATNLATADTIWKSTHSEGAAAMVAASLRRTWFLVPWGQNVMAPRTGSRPGDPLADLLFTTIMTEMLTQIHERAEQCGIWDQYVPAEVAAPSVTWVDDVAFSIQSNADDIRNKVMTLLSIVLDTAAEFGFEWL